MKRFLLTAAVFCSILLTRGAEEGLVGHWPMNEGTGTVIKDAGPAHLDGALENKDSVKWVDGRVEGTKALEFSNPNGTSGFVFVKSLNKTDFSKGVTVSCWILPSKEQVRNCIYTIAGDGRKNTGFLLMIHWQRLLFSGTGNSCEKYACSSFGKNPIAYGSWMYVTATWDPKGTYKVYIDGEPVAVSEEKLSGPIAPGSDALVIGSAYGYAGFLGAISDLKVYNRVLSDAEIMDAMSAE